MPGPALVVLSEVMARHARPEQRLARLMQSRNQRRRRYFFFSLRYVSSASVPRLVSFTPRSTSSWPCAIRSLGAPPVIPVLSSRSCGIAGDFDASGVSKSTATLLTPSAGVFFRGGRVIILNSGAIARWGFAHLALRCLGV